jgi:hypothetical protein
LCIVFPKNLRVQAEIRAACSRKLRAVSPPIDTAADKPRTALDRRLSCGELDPMRKLTAQASKARRAIRPTRDEQNAADRTAGAKLTEMVAFDTVSLQSRHSGIGQSLPFVSAPCAPTF